ncbi:MAG: hypothetical protein A2284_03855 [Deltaproteobacteria bacterium RIFOXYA12_FULL_61_11]|nr:MAG: hypothetical protein A2284_03855 [Deltaproteobacteria bacterium RIFOXYA12_FULL_61_11]
MNLVHPFRGQELEPGQHLYPHALERTGMGFALQILKVGEKLELGFEDAECAVLLLAGKCRFSLRGASLTVDRPHWIQAGPTVAHLAAGETVEVSATSQTRLAIVHTPNRATFPSRLLQEEMVAVEHRGRGLLEDTCYRQVRTVFDRTSAPLESQLVLGEVINFPGRWSSYPPHHHAQPELYYYEFSPIHGYGHAELGERVFKMGHQDLLIITDRRDHAQCAAPGFHLYYLWAIRHLSGNPYTGFEYTWPFDELI